MIFQLQRKGSKQQILFFSLFFMAEITWLMRFVDQQLKVRLEVLPPFAFLTGSSRGNRAAHVGLILLTTSVGSFEG